MRCGVDEGAGVKSAAAVVEQNPVVYFHESLGARELITVLLPSASALHVPLFTLSRFSFSPKYHLLTHSISLPLHLTKAQIYKHQQKEI